MGSRTPPGSGHCDSGARMRRFSSITIRCPLRLSPSSGNSSGNRDDHLRNHGFLWGEDGWRLAPAFDMNPSIDKHEHVLTIDGLIADPDIESAVATAGFYGIGDGRAREIVDKTRAIVSSWKERARKLGIAAGDIELTASAFSALNDSGRH